MLPLLLAGPALEPISLAEAKAWLRIDDNAQDDGVSALVTAARLIIEATTRRLLITQTWRLGFDAWPCGDVIKLPLAPLQTVAAVSVFDAAGVAHALPASNYFVDASPEAARLAFLTQPPQPGRAIAGIAIDVVVGYGASPSSVPEPLRHAIRMLVTRWFESRGDVETDVIAEKLPGVAAALIAPYRRLRA